MSDLVGNPKDMFSRDAAQVILCDEPSTCMLRIRMFFKSTVMILICFLEARKSIKAVTGQV